MPQFKDAYRTEYFTEQSGQCGLAGPGIASEDNMKRGEISVLVTSVCRSLARTANFIQQHPDFILDCVHANQVIQLSDCFFKSDVRRDFVIYI